MKRLVGLLVLSLLFSPYLLASPLQVRGIAHYRDGFLVLTAGSSSNTTQLWLYKPGKGFKLLNETFPNLTFVHSSGKEVLLYQNSSDHHYLQRFRLYVYDRELEYLGDYLEFDDYGVGSRIYWNGEFYLFLEIRWTTQEGSSYSWYAIINGSIHRLLPNEKEGMYFSGVWQIPHGYVIMSWEPESYRRELFFITLQNSHPSLMDLTPSNVSVEGLCFNGTHIASLISNRFRLISDNVSTIKYYLQIINMSEESKLVPLEAFDSKENVTLKLLGYTDGKWILKRVYSWWNVSELKTHHRTLGYITVSSGGIVEFPNSTIFKPVCKMVKPQKVFDWGQPIEIPMELNGKRVVINGTALHYGGMVIKLPFSPKMGDCGNGCLFSDGEKLVYFNGSDVQLVEFPRKNTIGTGFIVVFGLVFAAMLIVLAVKWARD